MEAVHVCAIYLGKGWHQDALWDDDKPEEGWDFLGNVLLGNPGFGHSCGH